MYTSELLKTLDAYAAFDSAESYDNVGLLVGDTKQEVKGIVFCVDCTMQVVQFALEHSANTIIAHHPLIFEGLQQIFTDTPKGAIIKMLLQNQINFVAMHTNLDNAEQGTAFAIASKLDLFNMYTPADAKHMCIGQLEYPITAKEFCTLVSEKFDFPARLYGEPNAKIQTLAIAPGAAGDAHLLSYKHQCQALLTGEMKHHHIIDAVALGMVVVDNSHHANEAPVMQMLKDHLQTIYPLIPMEVYLHHPCYFK